MSIPNEIARRLEKFADDLKAGGHFVRTPQGHDFVMPGYRIATVAKASHDATVSLKRINAEGTTQELQSPWMSYSGPSSDW